MNKEKNYSARDIERYHSGQMLPAERHAIEAAALDDPFLADALEGYSYSKDAGAELKQLDEKLQQRLTKKENKRVVMAWSKWLQAAAVFILVAGGGWLLFNSLNKDSKVVQNEGESAAYKLPEIKTDSVADKNDPAVVINRQDQMQDQTVLQSAPETSKKLQREKDIQQPKNSEEGNTIQLQEVTVSKPANEVSNEAAVDDKVLSDATSRSEEKKNAAPQAKQARDSVINMTIVLQEKPMAAEEVVVSKNKSNNPQKRYRSILTDSVAPITGWEEFDEYVTANMKSPSELKIEPVKGEVELSFKINNHGEAVDIKVEKSLCKKCDEEAIRLLKEGPKWKKKNKKGKVKIKF